MSATNRVTQIKDAEGATMTLGETDYQGQTLTHDILFSEMVTTLDNLSSYTGTHSDVWVVSFPKSGTHWLHEIVGILLSGRPEPHASYMLPSLVEINPDIRGLPQNEAVNRFNTHLQRPFLPTGVTAKGKMIYILRNPKSVAVSWYYFVRNLKTLEYEGTFTGFLPIFVQGIFSIWGTWFDHVTQYWKLSQEQKNVKVVFYEELIKSPAKAIKEISDFLGLNHSEEFCASVAGLSTLDKMRAGAGKSKDEKDKAASYYKAEGMKLFRKGKIEDWKSMFTVAQNEMFQQVFEEKMSSCPELRDRIQFS